jgi:hypothetical protein
MLKPHKYLNEHQRCQIQWNLILSNRESKLQIMGCLLCIQTYSLWMFPYKSYLIYNNWTQGIYYRKIKLMISYSIKLQFNNTLKYYITKISFNYCIKTHIYVKHKVKSSRFSLSFDYGMSAIKQVITRFSSF